MFTVKLGGSLFLIMAPKESQETSEIANPKYKLIHPKQDQESQQLNAAAAKRTRISNNWNHDANGANDANDGRLHKFQIHQ